MGTLAGRDDASAAFPRADFTATGTNSPSMKTLLALLLAGLGFGALALPTAQAQPVSPFTSGTDSVYVNETVVIRTGHHRRGHWERRVWVDRYGRRHVRRVWVRY